MTCVRITGPSGHSMLCSDIKMFEVDNPNCPNVANHEPWPRGYIQSSDYADKMMKTHGQSECPGCGSLLIWTPKQDATGDRFKNVEVEVR